MNERLTEPESNTIIWYLFSVFKYVTGLFNVNAANTS